METRECVRIVINKGEDDELLCTGYKANTSKLIVHFVFVLLTGGFLLLLGHWRPDWRLKLTCSLCPLLGADRLLLADKLNQKFVVRVHRTYFSPSDVFPDLCCVENTDSEEEGSDKATPSSSTALVSPISRAYFRYFDFQHSRYLWKPVLKSFIKLNGLESHTCIEFHDTLSRGLSRYEQDHKSLLYGQNIIHIEVKSYWILFMTEVVNPFYIFQIASMILWMLDEYVFYASCIIIISAISIVISLYETRKQSETLSSMVEAHNNNLALIKRKDDSKEEVCVSQIVPGDVVEIPPSGCTMSCDAVLISGNCIVNESMLTGESVPVTKTPLPHHTPDDGDDDATYSTTTHRRHTLYCGTQVLQTRYYESSSVRAVVIRTGFSTAKGELVRSILYPKPMGFKFYQDAIRFILFLAGIATCGMAYSIYVLYTEGSSFDHIALRSLDIITIVVPPALPAAMTVGIVYAQRRLKRQQIFCISPPRINVAGKIKLVCFDKTGTLTEEGLDVWGVVPVSDKCFQPVLPDPSCLTNSPLLSAMASCHSLTIINGEITGDPLDLKMFFSTKWLLTEPAQGADSKRYDMLAPSVVKPTTKDAYSNTADVEGLQEVGILHQFPFSSTLQRMSVITRTLGSKQMDLYCKGAPEKIVQLCDPKSVPDNFNDVLHSYTMQGFRVIALGHNKLNSKISWHQLHKLKRDSLENNLTLVGLLVMQNTLKPQTTPVILELRMAKIRTVMCTGDNILTAVSVARDCGMVEPGDEVVIVDAKITEVGDDRFARIDWTVTDLCCDSNDKDSPRFVNEQKEINGISNGRAEDACTIIDMNDDQQRLLSQTSYQSVSTYSGTTKTHLAITGRSFAIVHQYFPQLLDRIIIGGTIFARMSPDQKSQLVECYQALGYCIAMCGDGANDCGALKAAHVGISLSEAEASVASPFTSKLPDISCVPAVIREGRCALVTSFGLFKYMALYSMIQFITVLILYSRSTNLGDIMFLYIDLIITTSVAILMGYTAAYPRLVERRPTGSLIAATNLLSIVLQILIQLVIQVAAFFYLLSQEWYEAPVIVSGETDAIVCYETTLLFCVSGFQYLILSFAFSKGKPFRKSIYTNVPFLFTLLLLTVSTTLIFIHPTSSWIQPLEDWLQLKTELFRPNNLIFRITILLFSAINFVLSIAVEVFIIDSLWVKRIFHKVCCKTRPKNKYHIIENEINSDSFWPPIGEVTLVSVMGNI